MNTLHLSRSEKGFTLVELITAVVIAAIAFLGLTMAFEKLSGVYGSVVKSAAVIQDAHAASAFIERECRNIKDKSGIILATPTEFKFTNTSGTLVDITYSNSRLNRNNVMFADHITSCSIAYSKWDGTAWTSGATSQIAKLKISFTVSSGSYTYTTDQTIFLRNMR